MPTASPLADLQIDIFENMDLGSCSSEGQISLLQFDDGFYHARSSYTSKHSGRSACLRHRLDQS